MTFKNGTLLSLLLLFSTSKIIYSMQAPSQPQPTTPSSSGPSKGSKNKGKEAEKEPQKKITKALAHGLVEEFFEEKATPEENEKKLKEILAKTPPDHKKRMQEILSLTLPKQNKKPEVSLLKRVQHTFTNPKVKLPSRSELEKLWENGDKEKLHNIYEQLEDEDDKKRFNSILDSLQHEGTKLFDPYVVSTLGKKSIERTLARAVEENGRQHIGSVLFNPRELGRRKALEDLAYSDALIKNVNILQSLRTTFLLSYKKACERSFQIFFDTAIFHVLPNLASKFCNFIWPDREERQNQRLTELVIQKAKIQKALQSPIFAKDSKKRRILEQRSEQISNQLKEDYFNMLIPQANLKELKSKKNKEKLTDILKKSKKTPEIKFKENKLEIKQPKAVPAA